MGEVEEALSINNDDEEAAVATLLMGPAALRRGAWRDVDEDELDAELANLDEEEADEMPEWLKQAGGLRRRRHRRRNTRRKRRRKWQCLVRI